MVAPELKVKHWAKKVTPPSMVTTEPAARLMQLKL
jgi:hypothetical protein